MKMKNTQLDNDSENEFDVDEPEEVQNNASDDDWTPQATGRRQSSRLRGTPRPTLAEVSSSDEDFTDDEDGFESEEDRSRKRRSKPKRGGRRAKRPRVTSSTNYENSDSQGADGENKSVTNSDSEPTSTSVSSTKPGKEFMSGAFVVLKTDLHNEPEPPLWKIDGKALLQKYVPFEQDGKKYYRNTSVYSGWTVNNKDQYYSATVIFKQHNRKEHIIEFQRDLIKLDENPPKKSKLRGCGITAIKEEEEEEDDEEETADKNGNEEEETADKNGNEEEGEEEEKEEETGDKNSERQVNTEPSENCNNKVSDSEKSPEKLSEIKEENNEVSVDEVSEKEPLSPPTEKASSPTAAAAADSPSDK